MARRIVRKLDIPRFRPLEERLWPTLVALTLLTGMSMGTVAAYLRPDEPRWFANSSTWLVALPILALLAAFWMVLVDRGRRRRPIQLAIVLGMIAHLVLLIACLESHMVVDWVRRTAPTTEVVAKRSERPVVPLEFKPQVEPVPSPREWERPVATEEPVESPPQEVVRRTKVEPQTPVQPQPQPVPQPRPTIRPERVARRENRPSPTETRIATSRPARSSPKPAEASSPEASASRLTERRADASIAAPAAAEGRRSPASAAPVARSRDDSQRSANVSPQRLAQARTDPQPQVSPRASAARRESRSDLAAAPITSPTRTARRPANEQALQSQAVAMERRTTGARELSERATLTLEPQPQRSSAVPTRREVALPESVARASGRHSPIRRDTRRPVAPSTRIAQRSTPTSPQTQTPAIDAAQTQVARRAAASSPSEVRESRSAAESSREAAASVPRNVAVARSRSSADAMTVSAASASSPHRSRSVELAGNPVDRPTTTDTGAASGQADAALTAAAVHRGTRGVAGGGASPNVSRYSGAGPSPAQVASGSMTRRADMQDTPSGAALAPSSRSETPRRRAETTLGGTSVSDAPVALAGSASQSRLPELTASSSAGRRMAAADAAAGPTSAMKGTSAADLGVTRVVGQQQQGRAAGGGRPDVGSLMVAQSQPRRGRGSGRLAPRSSSPLAGASSGLDAAAGSRPEADSGSAIDAAPVAAAGRASAGGAAAEVAMTGSERGEVDNGERGEPIAGVAEGPPQLARSEAAGAAGGEPAVGSGTARPTRGARGPSLRLNTQAETEGVAVAGKSGDGKEAAAIALEPGGTGRISGGDVVGPVAGTGRRAGGGSMPSSLPGSGNVGRAASRGEAAEVAMTPVGGRRRGRSRLREISAGTGEAIDVPAGRGEGERGEGTGLAGLEHAGSGRARLARGDDGAADRGAARGPDGGSGDVPAIQVGIRRTEPADIDLSGTAGRFRARRAGGVPDVNTSVVIGRQPFQQRMARIDRKEPADGGRPGELTIPTEKAIELGLLFLKRCQSSDGSWKLDRFGQLDGAVQFQSDTAATGLALLAFQGAGYHHRSAKYGETIGAAIRFLIDHQRANGDLYVPTEDSSDQFCRLYSHGIAAIAMCEAYGMTQDPMLKEPAQKALDFIAASQDKEHGGWRYQPGRSSDTSVTGWMVMALKSGQLAGLDVSRETMARVEKWLGVAQVDDRASHLFRYNPNASDAQRHGRLASPSMTAVGLLMRMYAGWKRDDPRFRQGAEYLLETPPAFGAGDLIRRDTYYWYYATQVMYHVGGEWWERWYRQLYPLLLESQIQRGELAGSWDPLRPVPDRWAPHAGRIYVTTMNLLSLEVRYRILPLYEETIGGER